jgi:hypothetical protein
VGPRSAAYVALRRVIPVRHAVGKLMWSANSCLIGTLQIVSVQMQKEVKRARRHVHRICGIPILTSLYSAHLPHPQQT